MQVMDSERQREAQVQAAYNLYLQLAHRTTPTEGETLRAVADGLETARQNGRPVGWSGRDIYRLTLLHNAVRRDSYLAASRIGDLSRSRSGLTACSFTGPDGRVSVVFRGTGRGEWIDNGEGLSGIPEDNTYVRYRADGRITRQTVAEDHATDQQVEALNWFRRIAAAGGWDRRTGITLSGHSKGGNKAQFVAIHTDLVDGCYSFDGQGFSPEALAALRAQYGAAYDRRRQHLYSLSAADDYVNVLGARLMPPENIYFFESRLGLHYLEAMLEEDGRLRPPSEQGALSRYVEGVSDQLMALPPAVRQYATRGVMNVFQTYLGEGAPVNGDAVSPEETVAGLGIAVGLLLRSLIPQDPPEPLIPD